MHALIIEDEALIAILIEDCLRGSGFTSFDVAASCEDAIASASRKCPDLITAHVELDPGCGIDAVSAICSDSPIPVVFVTGSSHNVRQRMPHHLQVSKPFDPSKLIEIVQLALAGG